MKKLVIAGLAIVGLALGAYAQGSINIDNSAAAGGICVDKAGNYYGGTLGLEIWYLPGASAVPAGFNALGNGAAYAVLSAGTWQNELTIANKTTSAGNDGVIQWGEADLKDITPKGSTAVLAFAGWTGSGTSWNAALPGGGKFGVVGFVQATADYTTPPAPIPPDLGAGFSSDLVMTVIPEPSTFALAGLGAAALLIFRRRK
jgi:hypothetical protein